MRRCARARRDGSISRERRSSSGGRKEDGRSPTLRGISQDEHESITCSSRLTFILGLVKRRHPPFSLYCFSPYKAVAAPRCRTSPSSLARWSSPLPGPICSRTRTRPLPHHRPTRIIVEHVTSGRCRFEANAVCQPFARQISAARRLSENFFLPTLLTPC